MYQEKIRKFAISIENVRNSVAAIDKEINESGASMANLRENIRVRKLAREIVATQAEIDSHDMEEAAKSRRNFQEKYKVEKQKESEMQSKVSNGCCVFLMRCLQDFSTRTLGVNLAPIRRN